MTMSSPTTPDAALPQNQITEVSRGAADPGRESHRFLDLIEAGDAALIAEILDEDVTWVLPMSTSGDPEDGLRLDGRNAFLDRLRQLGGVTESMRFASRRVSVTRDETTTFVQAAGDFVTSTGVSYRNTYVFRLDWREGQLVSMEEYANPVAVQRAYPGFDEGGGE